MLVNARSTVVGHLFSKTGHPPFSENALANEPNASTTVACLVTTVANTVRRVRIAITSEESPSTTEENPFTTEPGASASLAVATTSFEPPPITVDLRVTTVDPVFTSEEGHPCSKRVTLARGASPSANVVYARLRDAACS
jgi:hypothetical protein